MKKIHLCLLGGALLLLGWLAVGQAQEGPDSYRGADMLYLRGPEDRLARLDELLHLSASQKTRVLRVFKRVDSSVKAAVEKGNEDIRAALDADRQAQFDEIKPDTEVAPTSMAAGARFRPTQGQGSGRGGQGGQGMGGGQGEQSMGGMQQGMGGMQQGMGGMQGGQGGQQRGRRMGPGGGRR